MSITQYLEGLSAAVAEARKRLGEIGGRFDILDNEIHVLQNAPSHIEEIIAAKRAELLLACQRFRNRTAEQSKTGQLLLKACLSDPDAQAYYMRDQIAAQIPGEVERLYPHAKKAMKKSDRDDAIAALTKEKAALTAEKEALWAELGALRRIVMPS